MKYRIISWETRVGLISIGRANSQLLEAKVTSQHIPQNFCCFFQNRFSWVCCPLPFVSRRGKSLQHLAYDISNFFIRISYFSKRFRPYHLWTFFKDPQNCILAKVVLWRRAKNEMLWSSLAFFCNVGSIVWPFIVKALFLKVFFDWKWG